MCCSKIPLTLTKLLVATLRRSSAFLIPLVTIPSSPKPGVMCSVEPINCVKSARRYPPTEVFTDECGTRGEVVHFQSFSESASKQPVDTTHIVLVPGNPGILGYYRPFLQSVWDRIGEVSERAGVHVHGLGLPGHDFRHLNGSSVFGIATQISYFLSYLRAHAARNKSSDATCNIILMGHSYGSYLALRLFEGLRENEYDDFSFVLLMPCVWHMGRCASLHERILLRNWMNSSSWVLSVCTSLVPPVLRDALIAMAGHDESVVAVTRNLVDGAQHRMLYRNMVALGGEETRTILELKGMPGLSKVTGAQSTKKSRPCLGIYAHNDKWCPEQAKQVIAKELDKDLDAREVPESVTHAFVLNKDETDLVVDEIVSWVGGRL